MEKKLETVTAENEITLIDLWRIVWKRRKMIAVLAVILSTLTMIVSLVMTNIYQTRTVIMPIAGKDGGGNLAMLAQQFSWGAGPTPPSGSSAPEIMNLIKSNILREKVIRNHQLLPVLFPGKWDGRNGKWKEGEAPDIWDGLRALDDIVDAASNLKDNTITLTVEFDDPVMAGKIAEYVVGTLTDHMSGEAKRVALTNRKYLEEQLGTATDPLIKQKIYSMISQQIETSMMAEVKENFAFKVIDPPKVPDRKFRPKRAVMTVIAFMIAVMLGIFVAFILEYKEKANGRSPSRPSTH